MVLSLVSLVSNAALASGSDMFDNDRVTDVGDKTQRTTVFVEWSFGIRLQDFKYTTTLSIILDKNVMFETGGSC